MTARKKWWFQRRPRTLTYLGGVKRSWSLIYLVQGKEVYTAAAGRSRCYAARVGYDRSTTPTKKNNPLVGIEESQKGLPQGAVLWWRRSISKIKLSKQGMPYRVVASSRSSIGQQHFAQKTFFFFAHNSILLAILNLGLHELYLTLTDRS